MVGLGGLPSAGDVFTATEDESAAREIAAVRQGDIGRYREI